MDPEPPSQLSFASVCTALASYPTYPLRKLPALLQRAGVSVIRREVPKLSRPRNDKGEVENELSFPLLDWKRIDSCS